MRELQQGGKTRTFGVVAGPGLQTRNHARRRLIQTDAASDVTTQPLVRSGFQKLRELDSFLEHCTPLLEAQLR